MSDSSATSVDLGDFELLYSTKVNGVIPVHKYKSKKTALKVVIADVDGPVVNGYFTLATEAHDDDGLPHTLEHLIFLGSDSYPYKGMLDILANRCLASGTNAWTDTDHTCYTMTTAGTEGFLALLPIYVDHILNPLLTDHGYITEVHHINGEGENSGVVYCEMQGCENSGEKKVHAAMLKAIYPGQCGYKSNTGGLLKNLRESTNNEKVRNYHKAFYRAENLVLIITGRIRATDVFTALKPVEETIVAKNKKNFVSFNRPWQLPVPPFLSSIDQLVPYACEEEEKGMVYISWRGPSATYQLYDMSALMMLMEYLTDTAVSPLQKAFVETSEPYASKVGYSFIENAESVVYLTFENVPVGKLGEIQPKLYAVMEPLSTQPLDMTRMQSVIQRRILEQQSHLENNPHDTVAFMTIGDILYGRSNEDFRRRLNPIEDLRALTKESASFWNELILRYLLGRPCVLTQGLPSVKEMEFYTTEELKRVEDQRKGLGPEGLKNKADLLVAALEHNDRQAPLELITSVPIPDINSISYHLVQRYCNRGENSVVTDCDRFPTLNQIPVRFQLDDVKTQFVYLFALMDTSLVSDEHRLFLPLLMSCLLESAVQRGDQLIPYESIVAQLTGDTVKTHAALGMDASDSDYFFCGSYSNVAVLMLQLEKEKYTKGVSWMHDLLRNTVFCAERVSVIAKKMVNDVARVKRKGNKMALALIRNLVFSDKSNHSNSSLVRQQHFLRKVIEDLGQSPDRVIRTLTELRNTITRPECLTFHMAAQLDSLLEAGDDPLTPWKTHMFADWGQPQEPPVDGLANLEADYQLLKDSTEQPTGAALSLGSVESCFLIQAVRSIDNIEHPDLAAVLVALQYLGQLEGPFWRQLRAQGLVYGYNLNLKVSEGLLYLSLYRATHPVGAYKEARAILQSHASDSDGIWEDSLLESARSSLIFELVEREKTMGDVVQQSVRSYLSGASADYNRQLIHRVATVTMQQMRRAYRLHLTALLDTDHCRCSIICHPSKLDEVVSGITALGQPVRGYTSVDDCPLNSHHRDNAD